ncbi:hypothetical protein GIB67_018775 [Kingdonia uniflora]|uniref:Uncharacterized protein n=1 Tax=Kingdonia uniflora TaxID=39325 RepID=A0A7J7NDM2_9MAGN|nr:hypothetical protein GIB67_018775 [Kingdonia uniflora]
MAVTTSTISCNSLAAFVVALSPLPLPSPPYWHHFEVVKPCGRINSCVVVGKDTLYIYGGMMEVRDQEITLDDLYTLNLSKLDEWKCVIRVC